MPIFDTQLSKEQEAGLPIGKTGNRTIFISKNNLHHHIGVLGNQAPFFDSKFLVEQLRRGGGLLVVEQEGQADHFSQMWRIAALAHRQSDVLLITPGNSAMSNTYNPILGGEADEIAYRITSAMRSSNGKNRLEYSKQVEFRWLCTLIAALQKSGMTFNLYELAATVTSAERLQQLLARLTTLDANCQEAKDLRDNLDAFSSKSIDNRIAIDTKRLKDTFSQLENMLFDIGTSHYRMVFNALAPEVKLFDAIRENKIIYIKLPKTETDKDTIDITSLFLGDLRTAISHLQKAYHQEHSHRPFLAYFDQAIINDFPEWNRIMEQSHAANMILCFGIHDMNDFHNNGHELTDMILWNTWNKIIFRPSKPETSEKLNNLIGDSHILVVTPNDGISRNIFAITENSTNPSQYDCMSLAERECILTDGTGNIAQLVMASASS